MNWDNVVADIIVALVPILATVLITLIGYGSAYLRQRYAWAREARAVAAVENALRALVLEVQQTLVDRLKAARADGKLTVEEARHVKGQVFAGMAQLLTDEQRKILAAVTGDTTAWISAKIEEILVDHKLQTSAVQARVAELAAPKSSPSGGSAA